jgi:penicillin amidase
MKYIFRISGIVLLLALTLIVVWESLLFSQSPNYSGTKLLKGIGSEVTVYRDKGGVPHILAKDAKSAYFALGYVVAQDRLFQMEIIRRLSQGRLAEILGEDLLPVDRMFRTLMLSKWAKEYSDSKTKLKPEAWSNLDNYLNGVNAYLEEGNLPIEFQILGIPPEPFKREDALSSLAYMGFSFAEGIKSDSLYTILSEKFPDRKISDLFPRYDYEKGSSILENQPTRPRLSAVIDSQIQKKVQEKKQDQDSSLVDSKLNGDGVLKSGMEPFVHELGRILSFLPPIEGSNSWVLSGERTVSGSPILCNDPHIGYSNPGTWYEAHMVYPGLNVYGYFLAGVPYPLVGNTDYKAWGLTMLENDDVDLYQEKISEDGTLYYHKNSWKKIEVVEESIAIKGKDPEKFSIRKTIHGPIYTDFVKGYTGKPLSLYWVFHHKENPLLEVLHNALYAKTKEEMRDAVSLVTAPGLNFSYIDRSGSIGWWGAGKFLLRNKPTNTRQILDGESGADDVVDLLPFSNNPQMENPTNGIIATANNLPTYKDFPKQGRLEGNWQPSDRFTQIVKFLSKKDVFDIKDMEQLILSTESESSFAIWEVYTNVLSLENPFIMKQNKSDQALIAETLKILQAWDNNATKESRGATVYFVLNYHVMKNLLLDEMGEENMLIYGSIADSLNAFKYLIQEENHPIWDNINTEALETRDDILQKSLVETALYLKTHISRSPSLWQWKNLYSIEYMHPIGMKKPMNLIFNVGPFSTDGAPEVVNNIKSQILDGTWKVKSGPSTRRIVSFVNMDENRTILPIGNSGNLASPFYKDQAEEYLNGNFRTTNFSEESIKKNAQFKMILLE